MTGVEIWEIGRTLTIGTDAEIKELRQRKNSPVPGHTTMDRHYKRIYKIVPEKYKHLIPDEIAAARQLSSFGDKLIEAFEKGWITSRTNRTPQIDDLYERMCGVKLAPRHR